MGNLLKNKGYSKEEFENILKNLEVNIKKINILKKENNFSFYIYTENRLQDNIDGYTIFNGIQGEYQLNIEGQEKTVKLTRHLVIEHKVLDVEEYLEYLIEKDEMNPELFELALGFNLETNKSEVIQLNRGKRTFEGFMPNIIGRQRSGKGVLMRFLLSQLAMNPMCEFIIIDKGNDFRTIYGSDKIKFQIDFATLTETSLRYVNFYTYLNIYSENKVKKLEELGYNDYKTYYKDYLKQKKEGVPEGEEKLPVIPYTVILNDELQNQRSNFVNLGGDSNVFDSLVRQFLSVSTFAGFKMIAGTQEPNIESMGKGFKGLSNLYYRIQYSNLGNGVSNTNSKILNSDMVLDARVFNFGDKWIKPPFSKAKDGMSAEQTYDDFLKRCFKKPIDYSPVRYSSVNDLIKSLTKGFTEEEENNSQILKHYKRIFKELGFTETEIREIETSDNFFSFTSIVFYVYFLFQQKILHKKEISILNPSKTFKNKVDSVIFSFIGLNDKSKEDEIKSKILGEFTDNSDESKAQFTDIFGKMVKEWYILEIGGGDNDLFGEEKMFSKNEEKNVKKEEKEVVIDPFEI